MRIGVGLAAALAILGAWAGPARADVKLPAIFGDRMVLQRDMPLKVWGWAAPGEDVTVKFRGQSRAAKAGGDGAWSVVLEPSAAGGPFEMVVSGKNTVTFNDVLVGEVWLASGQSNMHWELADSRGADLEIAAANHPDIRIISVPTLGTQEPQEDFKGEWKACSPDSVRRFSAVAYFFGRQLHDTLGVPVGLVQDSWSNSPCEAWIPRDRLEADPKLKDLLDDWKGREKAYEEAKAKGDPPRDLAESMSGNTRPGNLFAGMIRPVVRYGLRGVIWYQGEGNATRAYQYRDLFPLLIRSWRDAWGRDDLPFYWAQISDFMAEKPEPSDSAWAELREAQTMTLKRLPHTGEAVTVDLGEANDIHPRDKREVARRLARWALARDYGMDVACQSPTFRGLEKQGSKLVLAFDHVADGLRPFDVDEVRGFAVAGADGSYAWAQAKVVGPDKVEVWSDGIPRPETVRYAWADNPVCNLYNSAGLPVTPFRTDEQVGVSTLSRPQKALRLIMKRLPTIARGAAAALAAVLAMSMLGLFPWSPINSRATDVDLRSGRTRYTRRLLGLPVRRVVSETAVSRALAPEDLAAKPEWRRARTLSPWKRYSPHHDYYGAPDRIRDLADLWEARGAADDERRSEALALLQEWRERGRA